MTAVTTAQLEDNCNLYDASEGQTAAGRWKWSKHCAELLSNTDVTREQIAEQCKCDKSYVGRVVTAYKNAMTKWGGAPDTADKVREYQLICNKGPTVAKRVLDKPTPPKGKGAPPNNPRRSEVPWNMPLEKAFRAMKKQKATEHDIVKEITALSQKYLGWQQVQVSRRSQNSAGRVTVIPAP